MSVDDKWIDVAKEATKVVAKDVYTDFVKPILKPTAEVIGLAPRTIRAVLSPLERLVLQSEYNVEKTRKLLEEKLRDVPPERIEPPEPYIAVPALQYLSYCMDNHELRDMYANLLAKSMDSVVKNGVHPGFVEIIKQLCPDEARILRYISHHYTVPTVTLRYENEKGEGIEVVKNFSNIGDLTSCEDSFSICVYFDNLIRLGLLKESPPYSSLIDKNLYEPLKEHYYFKKCAEYAAKVIPDHKIAKFSENYLELTEYGKKFCRICITTPNDITPIEVPV